MRFILLALLCASLSANAYLLLRPASAGPATSQLKNASIHTSTSNHPDRPRDSDTRTPPPDAARLLTLLRANQFPEATINSLVRALLTEKYYARQREIYAAKKPLNAQAYWNNGTAGTRSLTKEERAELRELYRGIRTEFAALLGPNAHDLSGYYDLKFDYLPPAKAGQLYELDRDYSDIRAQLDDDINNFRVASDSEKLTYLEKERRKDLEALLSPEELRAYDLRHSSTARTLMRAIEGLNLTENEYTRLYDLRAQIDESYKGIRESGTKSADGKRITLTPETAAAFKDRQAERDQLKQQMEALIGPERLPTYQRNQDYDYTQLRKAQERFNLSPAAIDQTLALRETIGAASMRIAEDKALSPEQKQQALVQLAADARQQIRTHLGEEIGNAYLANENTARWLKQYIEKGQAIQYTSPTSYRTRPIAPSTRPPTSRPKPTPATPLTQ